MSGRVRSVLLGLGVAVALLLLLQLSSILRDAARAEGGATAWWMLAAYVAVGVVLALGVGLGARDRVLAITAAVVLLVAVAPSLPGEPLPMLPGWQLVGGGSIGVAVTAVALGALGYTAVRGSR